MNLMEEYYPYLQGDMDNVIEYFPIGLVIGLTCWIIIMALYRIITGKCSWKKSIRYFLFITYIAIVIQIAYLSRVPGSRVDVTLGFGDTWGSTLQAHAYVIENVMMFVPFGMLFPILGRTARYTCIPVAVCSSIALEGMQYITQRGYCQLDDVVANSIGAGIGYMITLLIYALYRMIKNRHKNRD